MLLEGQLPSQGEPDLVLQKPVAEKQLFLWRGTEKVEDWPAQAGLQLIALVG